jgi:hypothetical protein
MIIAVVHYSATASVPLLELWYDYYLKSGCKIPVVVVTDGMATLPEFCAAHIPFNGMIPPVSSLVVDPALIPNVIRKGNPFDVKGALVCLAVRRFGEVFFVDSDAFLLKNPEPVLASIPETAVISMGDDPYPTRIEGTDGALQRNAGVMVVKAKDPQVREALVANYCFSHTTLRNTPKNNTQLLEQFAWSATHHRYTRKNKAYVFPRALNWSRMWDRKDPNIVILHEHGPKKWEYVFKGTRFENLPPKRTGTLDPSKVVGLVLAHERAAEAVKRHLPYWLKVCSKVIITIPEEQRLVIDHPDVIVLPIVPNQSAYSPETSRRTHELMKASLEHPAEFYLLFEYDSLCWGPIPEEAIPYDGGVSACQWTNEARQPVPGKKFVSNIYLHFPQLYSRKGLQSMVDAISRDVSFDVEYGYGDRFLGYAAVAGQVPVKNLRTMGLSYSYENINSNVYPKRVYECIEAVKRGVIFTHGIKDEETLKTIAQHGPFGIL